VVLWAHDTKTADDQSINNGNHFRSKASVERRRGPNRENMTFWPPCPLVRILADYLSTAKGVWFRFMSYPRTYTVSNGQRLLWISLGGMVAIAGLVGAFYFGTGHETKGGADTLVMVSICLGRICRRPGRQDSQLLGLWDPVSFLTSYCSVTFMSTLPRKTTR